MGLGVYERGSRLMLDRFGVHNGLVNLLLRDGDVYFQKKLGLLLCT